MTNDKSESMVTNFSDEYASFGNQDLAGEITH